MTNISFNDDHVKTLTKEQFADYCAANQYQMSDVDIAGYWTKCNPTPVVVPDPVVIDPPKGKSK